MTNAHIKLRVETCLGKEETVTVTDTDTPLDGGWEGPCSLSLEASFKTFFGRYTNMEVRVSVTLPCSSARLNSGEAAEHASGLVRHAAHTLLAQQGAMFAEYLSVSGGEL